MPETGFAQILKSPPSKMGDMLHQYYVKHASISADQAVLDSNTAKRIADTINQELAANRSEHLRDILRAITHLCDFPEAREKLAHADLIDVLYKVYDRCNLELTSKSTPMMEKLFSALTVTISSLAEDATAKDMAGEKFIPPLLKASYDSKKDTYIRRQAAETVNALIRHSTKNKNILILSAPVSELKNLWDSVVGAGDYPLQANIVEILRRIVASTRKGTEEKLLEALSNDQATLEKLKRIKTTETFIDDVRAFLNDLNEKAGDKRSVFSMKSTALTIGDFSTDPGWVDFGKKCISFRVHLPNTTDSELIDFEYSNMKAMRLGHKVGKVIMEMHVCPDGLEDLYDPATDTKIELSFTQTELKFIKSFIAPIIAEAQAIKKKYDTAAEAQAGSSTISSSQQQNNTKATVTITTTAAMPSGTQESTTLSQQSSTMMPKMSTSIAILSPTSTNNNNKKPSGGPSFPTRDSSQRTESDNSELKSEPTRKNDNSTSTTSGANALAENPSDKKTDPKPQQPEAKPSSNADEASTEKEATTPSAKQQTAEKKVEATMSTIISRAVAKETTPPKQTTITAPPPAMSNQTSAEKKQKQEKGKEAAAPTSTRTPSTRASSAQKKRKEEEEEQDKRKQTKNGKAKKSDENEDGNEQEGQQEQEEEEEAEEEKSKKKRELRKKAEKKTPQSNKKAEEDAKKATSAKKPAAAEKGKQASAAADKPASAKKKAVKAADDEDVEMKDWDDLDQDAVDDDDMKIEPRKLFDDDDDDDDNTRALDDDDEDSETEAAESKKKATKSTKAAKKKTEQAQPQAASSKKPAASKKRKLIQNEDTNDADIDDGEDSGGDNVNDLLIQLTHAIKTRVERKKKRMESIAEETAQIVQSKIEKTKETILKQREQHVQTYEKKMSEIKEELQDELKRMKAMYNKFLSDMTELKKQHAETCQQLKALQASIPDGIAELKSNEERLMDKLDEDIQRQIKKMEEEIAQLQTADQPLKELKSVLSTHVL
eukprot:GEZU01023423.1.p1 GENE.GEZU01023423.1~~GEZU01023423.1.p1  ORF type:complete len:1000 (-),score=382.66 GEZU01023423.1:485-3484(-)